MAQLEQSTYWTFSGDAISEGAPYNFYENSAGLHIGVQAVSPGTYAGFYAVSPVTSFVLVHTHVKAPVQTIPQGVFEAGIYVQTSDGDINYVTCTSQTTSSGTIWELVWATGNTNQATNFTTLWSSGIGLPLSEDCTIITNGNNYLKLFLDGSLVYSSSSLNLNIPPPFQVYLEPETSYSGAELYASYLNYYLTSGEYLTVNNLPSNAATVELVNASNGQVLASSPVTGTSAKIEVGNFLFPLSAEIEVLDSSGTVIASTSGAIGIYGGDVYTVSAVTTTVSITVKTVSTTGKQITGLYTTISNSAGQIVDTGYSPVTYTGAVKGQSYTVCVSNYDSYTFLHWANGSTDPCATRTPTSNIVMTATFST